MTELTDLLDQYTARLATLPVPPLDVPPDYTLQRAMKFRSLGLRVTDRLLPGATEAELGEFEAELGYALPAEAREWFQWHNGHAGGLADVDDTIANLLPFARQLDLSWSMKKTKNPDLPEFLTQNDHPLIVMHVHWDYFIVECGPSDPGSVWFLALDDEYARIYDSLSDLVRQAIVLADLGWIILNKHGGAELIPEETLEADGIVFADDRERCRYRTYGRLPASMGE